MLMAGLFYCMYNLLVQFNCQLGLYVLELGSISRHLFINLCHTLNVDELLELVFYFPNIWFVSFSSTFLSSPYASQFWRNSLGSKHRTNPYAVPWARPGGFPNGQMILPLADTIDHEEFLETFMSFSQFLCVLLLQALSVILRHSWGNCKDLFIGIF